MHDKEWSSDFLRSTKNRDKMSSFSGISNEFSNAKVVQSSMHHQWASEYLQDIPLIEPYHRTSQQSRAQLNPYNGMYIIYI